jgi:hypothetical protein
LAKKKNAKPTTPDKAPKFNLESLVGKPDANKLRRFGQSASGMAAFEKGQVAQKAAAAKALSDQKAKDAQARAAMQAALTSGTVSDRLKPLVPTPSFKKGGAAKKKAVPVKKYAKGGSIDGCAIRGKTRAVRNK